MNRTQQRAAILTVLAVVMAATRLHHFEQVPDASWAVMFVGGYYLDRGMRWAFALLMALAVLVDALVIGSQGTPFWSHYCVTPAYLVLPPAYFILWAGGAWLARNGSAGRAWSDLARLVPALLVSVLACHLLAQGGFYYYWSQATGSALSVAGWAKNYTDWLPAYLQVTALYVAIAAALHVAIARLLPATRDAAALR